MTFWEIIWRKSFCKNSAEDEVSGWWSQFFPQKISFQWKKGLTVVAFTAFPSLAPTLVSPASSSVEPNLLASYFESGPHFLIFRCYKIRGKGNFFRTKPGFCQKLNRMCWKDHFYIYHYGVAPAQERKTIRSKDLQVLKVSRTLFVKMVIGSFMTLRKKKMSSGGKANCMLVQYIGFLHLCKIVQNCAQLHCI